MINSNIKKGVFLNKKNMYNLLVIINYKKGNHQWKEQQISLNARKMLRIKIK